MDKQTSSSIQKIIRLTNAEGVVSWMLFSENRKTVRSDGDLSIYSDQVDIQLRALGSFDWRGKGGAVAMKMRGQASGSFTNTVNFSDGYIVVEEPWKGQRIGTYMMNHLVAWAKENYPDSSLVGIRLGSNQAYEENRERRNRFYDRFGFKFTWDDEQREGYLDPVLRISDLRTTDKWEERIAEFSVEEGAKELFSEADRLRLDCSDSKIRALSAINAMNYAKVEVERCRAERRRWGLFGLALGFILAVVLMLNGL